MVDTLRDQWSRKLDSTRYLVYDHFPQFLSSHERSELLESGEKRYINATNINNIPEFGSCVKVEVAVLGFPSWAFRPNEPYGFRGRKAILNRASALVTIFPNMSTDIRGHEALLHQQHAPVFVCSTNVWSRWP